jgi:intracellular sulfur oxidation DsrE/DsrF family protein
MSKFLLIESRDPFESNDVNYYYDLASNLAASGHAVTLYLVQNGVLAARRSEQAAKLSALASAGVTVVADDFSLRERGIAAARLTPGVKEAPIDVVVDHLAEGARTLWH